jgi:hypothetical protein
MNIRLIYFLRPVPLVLAIFLVWPPTVLLQEKKPSPATQLPDEKKDPLDAFFAERDKKEAITKATCQNLADLSKISERSWQNRLTNQDRELIQDRERWLHAVKEVILCSEKLSGDDRAEALVVVDNLMKERMEYLESRERGLVAKYNDLVASYNELVTLAAVAILHPSPTAPSSYPWLKPTAPISGPVVCRGNTSAMGQGITNIHVNCN